MTRQADSLVRLAVLLAIAVATGCATSAGETADPTVRPPSLDALVEPTAPTPGPIEIPAHTGVRVALDPQITQFTIRRGGLLTVNAPNSLITVNGVDSAATEIRATAFAVADLEPAARAIAQTASIESVGDENGAVINAGLGGPPTRNATIWGFVQGAFFANDKHAPGWIIEIDLPHGVGLSVYRCWTAEVWRTRGPLDLHAHGSVRITGVEDTVKARASDGVVTCDDGFGEFTLAGGNGVAIRRTSGRVTATSDRGAILAEGGSGVFDLSASGDVRANRIAFDHYREHRIESRRGSVWIHFTGEQMFDLTFDIGGIVRFDGQPVSGYRIAHPEMGGAPMRVAAEKDLFVDRGGL
jgi:hypothetical protein